LTIRSRRRGAGETVFLDGAPARERWGQGSAGDAVRASGDGDNDVYQHCSEHHLHRYLAELDFRYSNRSALGVEDQDRASRAMSGIVGKRLTYQQSNEI
jgi:hypothetical protein